MADNSPTNGQPLDETQYIYKSQRQIVRADDYGRIPKLESDGYLDASFLRYLMSITTISAFDGATQPAPIYMRGDGIAGLSLASVGNSQKFSGFSITDTTGTAPQYLGGASIGNGTQSFTAPAGVNRYILIHTYHLSSATAPSGITWNGIPLVSLGSASSGSVVLCTSWGLAIGDSVSAEVHDLVFTGSGASNTLIHHALVYGGVDQITPTGIFDSGTDSGGSVTHSFATTSGGIIVAGGITQGVTNDLSGTGVTVRFNERADTGDIIPTTGDNVSLSITGGSTTSIIIGVQLNPAPASCDVLTEGIVNGFTSLVKGRKYFVSDDVGGISLTGAGAYVGIAISSTEILIQRKRMTAVGVVSGASGRVELGFRPSIIRATGGAGGSVLGGNQSASGVWKNGEYASAYGTNSTAKWATSTNFLIRDAFGTDVTVTVDATGFDYVGGSNTYWYYEAEE